MDDLLLPLDSWSSRVTWTRLGNCRLCKSKNRTTNNYEVGAKHGHCKNKYCLTVVSFTFCYHKGDDNDTFFVCFLGLCCDRITWNKISAHQTEVCPQTGPAGCICSGQAVPHGKTCVCVCVTVCANVHECMHVYVHALEQKWGYKQGCCVIVYTLRNKTRRAGG